MLAFIQIFIKIDLKINVEGRIFLNSHKDRRKHGKTQFFCEMYNLKFIEYHSTSKMSCLGTL